MQQAEPVPYPLTHVPPPPPSPFPPHPCAPPPRHLIQLCDEPIQLCQEEVHLRRSGPGKGKTGFSATQCKTYTIRVCTFKKAHREREGRGTG